MLVRKKTERSEIKNKLVFVVGSNYKIFKKKFTFALFNKPPKKYSKIFGDSNSVKKICKIVTQKIR